MKNMTNIAFCCLLLICSTNAAAQLKFYAEASGAYSFIPDHTEKYRAAFPASTGFISMLANYDIESTFDSKAGFQVNVGATKALSKRFNIDIGLGYAYYAFQVKSTHISIPLTKDAAFSSNGDRKTVLGEPTNNFFGVTYVGTTAGYNAVDADGNQLYDLAGNPITLTYQNSSSTGTFSQDNGTNTTTEIIQEVDLSDSGETTISYFTIPIRISYELIHDKLQIAAGVINAVVMHSSKISYTPTYTVLGNNTSALNYWTLNNTENQYPTINAARTIDYERVKNTSSNGFNNYNFRQPPKYTIK